MVAVVSCVGGCVAPPEMDLATNPEFYAPTGYAAKLPADRAVFVAPVVAHIVVNGVNLPYLVRRYGAGSNA